MRFRKIGCNRSRNAGDKLQVLLGISYRQWRSKGDLDRAALPRTLRLAQVRDAYWTAHRAMPALFGDLPLDISWWHY
jgi:hypothetical protein